MKIPNQFLSKNKPFAQVVQQTADYQEFCNSIILIRDFTTKSKLVEPIQIDVKNIKVVDLITYPDLTRLINQVKPTLLEPITNEIKSFDNILWYQIKVIKEPVPSTYVYATYINISDIELLGKMFDNDVKNIRNWKTNDKGTMVGYITENLIILMFVIKKEIK